MSEKPKGMLVLEDGSAYVGESMGACGEWVGEVVFNTSMTGYQEIITDPSYWGQMVAFTYPHIGNVGVNREDAESTRPYVRAVLARKICEHPSNWRSQQPLPEYLRAHGVPALSGLDTRRLTLTLREKGSMRGALSTVNLDSAYLLRQALSAPAMSALDAVGQVAISEETSWAAPAPSAWEPLLEEGLVVNGLQPRIVVVDCGTKRSILYHLARLGARVSLVPATASAAEVMAHDPEGVLFANGPGDPSQAVETIATARELLGRVPLFGICLGHQVLGLACGARCYRLPFGHHGVNHPVRDLTTGEVEITTQNHHFAIAADSIDGLPLEITQVSLYDGTIEGLRHKELPVASVQYQPEASPGPHDGLHLLRGFVNSLKKS